MLVVIVLFALLSFCCYVFFQLVVDVVFVDVGDGDFVAGSFYVRHFDGGVFVFGGDGFFMLLLVMLLVMLLVKLLVMLLVVLVVLFSVAVSCCRLLSVVGSCLILLLLAVVSC